MEHLNERGWTPLYTAAFRKQKDTLISLLAEGHSPAEAIGDGQTPLHAASWHGAFFDAGSNGYKWGDDIIEILVDAGADVNAQDAYGVTPLHIAVSGYTHGIWSSDGANPVAAAALRRRGADPNPCDHNGFTPLMVAATAGDGEMQDEDGLRCIWLLLDRGADPCRRANQGVTALELARTAHKKMKTLNEQPQDSRWKYHLYWADTCVELLEEAIARAEPEQNQGGGGRCQLRW